MKICMICSCIMMIGRAARKDRGRAEGMEVQDLFAGADFFRAKGDERKIERRHDKKIDSLVFWHGQVYGKNVPRVYGIPIDGLQERAIRHPCLHHDCRRRMNNYQAATVR